MKTIIFILLFTQAGFASEILKDFDSLGGNDELLKQVNTLQSTKKVKIVQNRIVNRFNRHEITANYNQLFGGDSYIESSAAGLQYNYHINPRWSLGLSYSYYFNSLSAEGENLINDFQRVPDMDYLKQSVYLNAAWYPIYGKFSLYDLGVVHFDLYTTIGYGQITLESGVTNSYTAGGGFAFWFSQHLSSRIEVRYQNYEAQRFNGSDNIGATVASFNMGYLL